MIENFQQVATADFLETCHHRGTLISLLKIEILRKALTRRRKHVVYIEAKK